MDMVITNIENALENITDIGHVVSVVRRERKFQESKRAFIRIHSAKCRAYKQRLKTDRHRDEDKRF